MLEKNLKIINLRLAEFQQTRSVLNISDKTFLDRLRFIDEVTARYAVEKQFPSRRNQQVNSASDRADTDKMKVKPVSEKTGLFPGSITRSFQKVFKELSPGAEQKAVRDFRDFQQKNKNCLKIFSDFNNSTFFKLLAINTTINLSNSRQH